MASTTSFGNGSHSNKSIQTPQSLSSGGFPEKAAESALKNPEETIPNAVPCTDGGISFTEASNDMNNGKRKLRLNHQPGHVPAVNLDRLFIQTEAQNREQIPIPPCKDRGPGVNCDDFSDDLFYEGLDLDEVEAQATLLLHRTSQFTNQQNPVPKPDLGRGECLSSPSFDLGI